MVQLLFLFGQSHLIKYICFFLLAFVNVKNGCAYAWCFELAGSSNKQFVTTVINVFDRSTLLILGFFLLFVTRWWIVIAGFYWTLGVVSWFLIRFQIPESPMWLLMQNREDEAINNLNYIAKVNGVSDRIDADTEFEEMVKKAEPAKEEVESYHSFVASVTSGLSAASFEIHAVPTEEQKEKHLLSIPLEKRKKKATEEADKLLRQMKEQEKQDD